MHAVTARFATPRDLWATIPLELIVSALAVILAGGLELAGLMP